MSAIVFSPQVRIGRKVLAITRLKPGSPKLIVGLLRHGQGACPPRTVFQNLPTRFLAATQMPAYQE